MSGFQYTANIGMEEMISVSQQPGKLICIISSAYPSTATKTKGLTNLIHVSLHVHVVCQMSENNKTYM